MSTFISLLGKYGTVFIRSEEMDKRTIKSRANSDHHPCHREWWKCDYNGTSVTICHFKDCLRNNLDPLQLLFPKHPSKSTASYLPPISYYRNFVETRNVDLKLVAKEVKKYAKRHHIELPPVYASLLSVKVSPAKTMSPSPAAKKVTRKKRPPSNHHSDSEESYVPDNYTIPIAHHEKRDTRAKTKHCIYDSVWSQKVSPSPKKKAKRTKQPRNPHSDSDESYIPDQGDILDGHYKKSKKRAKAEQSTWDSQLTQKISPTKMRATLMKQPPDPLSGKPRYTPVAATYVEGSGQLNMALPTASWSSDDDLSLTSMTLRDANDVQFSQRDPLQSSCTGGDDSDKYGDLYAPMLKFVLNFEVCQLHAVTQAHGRVAPGKSPPWRDTCHYDVTLGHIWQSQFNIHPGFDCPSTFPPSRFDLDYITIPSTGVGGHMRKQSARKAYLWHVYVFMQDRESLLRHLTTIMAGRNMVRLYLNNEPEVVFCIVIRNEKGVIGLKYNDRVIYLNNKDT